MKRIVHKPKILLTKDEAIEIGIVMDLIEDILKDIEKDPNLVTGADDKLITTVKQVNEALDEFASYIDED